MECREVLARFSDFLDGGLREAERGEVAEHLSACERCTVYGDVLSEGLESYRALPEPDLSDDFYLRLQHRLFHVRETSRPKGRARTLLRGAVPTLSASVVFLFGVLLFSSQVLRPGPPAGSAAGGPVRDGAKTADGALIPAARRTARGTPIGSGQQEMNRRFVRNNIWKVLAQRSADAVSAGALSIPGSGREIVPLQVSSTAAVLAGRGEAVPYRPLGVSVVPVLFQLEGDEPPESRKGLRIVSVEEMSPALSAGIRNGDIIVALDHIPVGDAGELARLVQSFAFQTKTLQIYREGRLIEIPIGL